MELRLAFLTRRAKGGVSTNEEQISAEVVRIGRGTENEIYLPDPRVPLRMAILHHNANGLFCESAGATDLRLNGNVVRNAQVALGDVIGVGPYEIVVVEPPEDKDAAITVELTQPMGDDVKELLARSRTTLSAGRMN
ncbi:MAG: FHA domain-containing protein, partial [Alphaproteobacteria bacterium]|nr:FHA domain-containing protein [Alphaproteobacteria bacterium]